MIRLPHIPTLPKAFIWQRGPFHASRSSVAWSFAIGRRWQWLWLFRYSGRNFSSFEIHVLDFKYVNRSHRKLGITRQLGKVRA